MKFLKCIKWILLSTLILSGNLQAQFSVPAVSAYRNISNVTISSVASVTAFTVHNGTLWEDAWAQLPDQINVTLSNGGVVPATVSWLQGTYVGTTEAAYTVYGNITNPTNVTNPNSLQASCVVTVDVAYVFRLRFWKLKTMLQEQYSGTPVTDVNSDGESIGTIYDYGRAAYVGGTNTSARPTLGSDATQANWVSFGSAGGFVFSQKAYFAGFNAVTPVYSVLMKVKITGGNLTNRPFFLNLGANGTVTASTDIGLHWRLSSNNRFRIFSYKANATNIYDYSPATTFTSADGWITFIVTINGTGASAGTIRIKNESGSVDLTETFTVNAGVASVPTDALRIGSFANFAFGSEIQVLNRVVTSGEITAFKSYNPARDTNFDWIRTHDFNPQNVSYFYSDTGGTTQAVNNDGVALALFDNPTLFGDYKKEWNQSNSSWRPALKIPGGSALNYCDWDGTDDTFTVNSGTTLASGLSPEMFGRRATFVIAQNDDVALGSHFLSRIDLGDKEYLVQTGSGYTSGIGSGPYAVLHFDPNFNYSVGDTDYAGETDNQIFFWALTRNNDTFGIWGKRASASAHYTTAAGQNLNFTYMGANGNSDASWYLDGRVYRVTEYSGVIPDAVIIRKRSWARTYYGIN